MFLSAVRLFPKLANENNVDTLRHSNMSHCRFESSDDSRAATKQFNIFRRRKNLKNCRGKVGYLALYDTAIYLLNGENLWLRPISSMLIKIWIRIFNIRLYVRMIMVPGGRNVTVSLQSRTGHTNMLAVVGALVFTQYWYWFPLAHCLALAFTPTCIIALNAQLKMPKLEIRSNARPSVYAYPAPLEEKKREEREKITTAVLSIAARARRRESERRARDSHEKMEVVSLNNFLEYFVVQSSSGYRIISIDRIRRVTSERLERGDHKWENFEVEKFVYETKLKY